MKFLKLLLLSFIMITCQSNQMKAQENKTLVGMLQDDKAVLTVDKAKMLATYNSKLLKASGIDAKFTDLTIKTTRDNQYFLVFKGSIYSSSFIVTEDNSNLYANPGISCTTSECASEDFGCTPKVSGVGCYPCNNKGKCTKTVSSDSLIE